MKDIELKREVSSLIKDLITACKDEICLAINTNDSDYLEAVISQWLEGRLNNVT